MDVCNKFDEDIHEATERNEASTICDTFVDDNFVHTVWRILCFRSLHPFEPFLHNAHHPTSEKKILPYHSGAGQRLAAKTPFFRPRALQSDVFCTRFPPPSKLARSVIAVSQKEQKLPHPTLNFPNKKRGAIVCFFYRGGTRERYSYVLIKFSAPCAQYPGTYVYLSGKALFLPSQQCERWQRDFPRLRNQTPLSFFPLSFSALLFSQVAKINKGGKGRWGICQIND